MKDKSKVILLPCDSYEEEQVYICLQNGLSLLGGIERFVSKEEKILLKPNLLKRADVDKAVITHPVVIGAFARILRECGYSNIVLGDSCGHGTTGKVLAGTGMDFYMEKYKIPMLDFDEGVQSAFPEGIQTKQFVMSRQVLEADAVINLCKMKTHALERVTGAVKNLYGCIYGRNKALGHTQFPSADSFARMLIDIQRFVRPRLHIMDGIVAMEGNGPGSGDPIPMKVILMSKDPVALDTVFCQLIHLEPSLVPTNYHGEKMGLGNSIAENIEILTPQGIMDMKTAVKNYGNEKFHVDRSRQRKNAWIRLAGALNIFQKKPYIRKEKCVCCGICVESCPVDGKALDFKKGSGQPPMYDYKKCIRCFCCQEMCPKKAIQVK